MMTSPRLQPASPVSFDAMDELNDCDDDLLLLFASPESRCLGIPRRLGSYTPRNAAAFVIVDEPNNERELNIKLMEACFARSGGLTTLSMQHADAIFGLQTFRRFLEATIPTRGTVSIDISTFPRSSLLLVLRAIELAAPTVSIRILYTEAEHYDPKPLAPHSHGIRSIGTVPTFVSPFSPSGELVLLFFLGYEGDRALGVLQNIEPHKVIAAVPNPAYHREWQGLSERFNATLLAGLDLTAIRSVDPRNPNAAYAFLKSEILDATWNSGTNFYVAPLGTKPQVVGVYAFYRDFPGVLSIAYASPVAPNQAYMSQGIGQSWCLPFPERIRAN